MLGAMIGALLGSRIIAAFEIKDFFQHANFLEFYNNKTVLGGVPASLPTMIKAYRIQEKAASVGFDWEYREQVWNKVKEEIAEFQAEADKMDSDKMEAELGDVFFSLVNAARLYDINPDTALERTNKKFIERFNFLEAETITKGRNLKEMTLAEMDEIWERAKNEV